VDEPKTFAATAIQEAVARRARVDLVIDPVTPHTPRRLISRLLGVDQAGDLALVVPTAAPGDKVFLPAGWQVGLAFELADLWMQSRTTVVGHSQFPLHPTRRVDALTVASPAKILSCNERRKRRHHADPLKPVQATILTVIDPQGHRSSGEPVVARLRNWSQGGLGLEFTGPHTLAVNCQLIVQVRIPGLVTASRFRGTVRHVTLLGPGAWMVGLGDVEELPTSDALLGRCAADHCAPKRQPPAGGDQVP